MNDKHHRKPAAQGETKHEAAFTEALVTSLQQACSHLPASTQAALAARRTKALARARTHWHWGLAASVLVVFAGYSWQSSPPDSDAIALEIVQTDQELLDEIDFLESLAEVDGT